jgi:bifunctional non-homologous end joining protein LigD
MTAAFPEISEIAATIKADTAIIDGELVAFQPDGLPSFQLLQGRLSTKITAQRRKATRIIYYVFDLIYLDGFDLRRSTLVDRKGLLKTIFQPAAFARYSDHIETEGVVLYQKAAEAGLEGIVAKKANSRYVQGRTKQWLKIKPEKTVDVVICGYTDPRNSREYFGGLVAGVYDDDSLIYCGRVGSGFSRDLLAQVFTQLQALATPISPFDTKIPPKDVHWVKPELVATVKYLEWTHGGELRHPVFAGLRPDKNPRDCKIDQLSPA